MTSANAMEMLGAPKRGEPLWWTALKILPVAFVALCVIGLLALAALPLRQGGEPPQNSEARASLGAMKDRARVVYQRNPKLKTITKADLGLGKDELNGSYFKDEDYTCGGTPENFWLKCRGVFDSEPTDMECSANLVTGSATFNR